MKIPDWLACYESEPLKKGGADCPQEAAEQATFFGWLRREYPNHGAIAIHPRNEGRLVGGQFSAIRRHKAEGMVKGAADIIIPGAPAFVCELKRRDKKKSRWQDGQIEYLESCHRLGAFTCVAFGSEAAKKAFLDYLTACTR